MFPTSNHQPPVGWDQQLRPVSIGKSSCPRPKAVASNSWESLGQTAAAGVVVEELVHSADKAKGFEVKLYTYQFQPEFYKNQLLVQRIEAVSIPRDLLLLRNFGL